MDKIAYGSSLVVLHCFLSPAWLYMYSPWKLFSCDRVKGGGQVGAERGWGVGAVNNIFNFRGGWHSGVVSAACPREVSVYIAVAAAPTAFAEERLP